jgi:hypothetical protein
MCLKFKADDFIAEGVFKCPSLGTRFSVVQRVLKMRQAVVVNDTFDKLLGFANLTHNPNAKE